MKFRMQSKFVFLIAVLFFSACYYDKEEILYPETLCAPEANPSFSAVILPLLNAKCNTCHSGTSASAGIRLDSFNEVVRYANNGSLMGSITYASGYSPMPKNGNKMTSCEIQKIQAWISTGLSNN